MNRRTALLALAAVAAAGPGLAASPGLSLTGRFVQGGYAIGHTAPRAEILVDGVSEGHASASGLFVVGFDREVAVLGPG